MTDSFTMRAYKCGVEVESLGASSPDHAWLGHIMAATHKAWMKKFGKVKIEVACRTSK